MNSGSNRWESGGCIKKCFTHQDVIGEKFVGGGAVVRDGWVRVVCIVVSNRTAGSSGDDGSLGGGLFTRAAKLL